MMVASMSGTAITLALLASTLLILLNGFFVAYEFAVVAARRSAFEEDQAGNGRVVKAARKSLRDLSMQLAGAQLGITIATLTLARVGEPALEALIEVALGTSVSPEVARAIGFGVALAVFTFLHLIFGEMVPKNIALTVPEATLRWSVLPYRMYLFLFRPIVSLLNNVANAGCRLVGIEPADELLSVHTASELATIVHRSQEGGAIDSDDAELLQGALEFAQRPVAEIATLIDDHASVVLGATWVQLERVVAETGIRRVLVVEPGQPGKPIGYLHVRDLLAIAKDMRSAPIPASFVRKTALVQGDQSLIQVLRTLRRVRRQLAVVEGNQDNVSVVSVEEVIRALVEPSADNDVDPSDNGQNHNKQADPLDVLGQVLSTEG